MGTMVLNVPKKVFSEMEVILPPFSIQEKFIKFMNLANEEHKIMDKIYQKRKQLMDSMITNSLIRSGGQI